ncbi:hypothetical protein AWC38_SpisGene18154 [Stylophora pistillata]|uniref:Uncharacterized protein n=1 Tax=Stylophora pistillata TaxID=50429 RepID=A0A2B4RIT8_STYPI|nr:hypothetical protein AWC38_SpisGene18154 [Stylophora pistillata]
MVSGTIPDEIAAVFKATIGLLVEKVRDGVAGKLKDGDVTDQKFNDLIVRDIDDISSKLDPLSRRDLEASVSFFEEGIALLYKVFKIARAKTECGALTAQAACDEAFSLIEGIRRLELTRLDESATRKLSTAKERFKDASREGKKMATILEAVDNPSDAVEPCRVCVKELNCLPTVHNSFYVQLKKGIKTVRSMLSKEERREIISSVCHVNRVIYDVMRTFGEDANFWIWPTFDTGENKINPLKAQAEGPDRHRYKRQRRFHFREFGDRCVKVFDRDGKLVKHFSLPADNVNTKLYIHAVAIDMNDNIFVLTELERPATERSWWVSKLTKIADLHLKFRLRGEGRYRYKRLSVSDTEKVLTLRDATVEIYDPNGKFVQGFEEGICKLALDVIVATDGRAMEVDLRDFCVNILSEHGHHLNKFKLQRNDCAYTSITFHRGVEHVVVAGAIREKELLWVGIYSKDGEFVLGAQIQIDKIFAVRGITVTNRGHIAVVTTNHEGWRVEVFLNCCL